MLRADLLTTLKRVQPALAQKDLVPVLQCFSFDGTTAIGYDDVVAIRVPCETPIKGCINGKLLLDFLGASRARDLEFEEEEEQAVIKASRAKLKVPLIPLESFLFSIPSIKKAYEIPLTPKLISMIRACSISMGTDAGVAWRFGLTMALRGEQIHFYATDNISMTHGRVKRADDKATHQAILPPRFCDLLVSLNVGDTAKSLYITSGHVQATFESGLRLFSRTVDDFDADKYEKSFASIMDGASGKRIEIPKGLESSLDRALILDTEDTTFSVKEGKLRLHSKSQIGEVRDVLSFPGHPDVTVKIKPKLIRRGLSYCERMTIVEDRCLLMEGANFSYMSSVIEEKK